MRDPNNPVPQAVRGLVHAHSIVPNYEYSQVAILREAEERAYWLAVREVIREEMTDLLDEREQRD